MNEFPGEPASYPPFNKSSDFDYPTLESNRVWGLIYGSDDSIEYC